MSHGQLPQDSLYAHTFHMTFGEHIRQWREERGLGLRQFAKAVGVSPTFLSKMERGLGALPGEETIRNMAKILGKDADELLAMADKVAADVQAIIIKEPAYARFLRAQAHLTKDQWYSLSRQLASAKAKRSRCLQSRCEA
jgi:transcriptional regulator with XRE-family HTH domain